MSQMMRSGASDRASPTPRFPSSAATTSKPSERKAAIKFTRIDGSSSMTKIFFKALLSHLIIG
jgi:hypothetical protein